MFTNLKNLVLIGTVIDREKSIALIDTVSPLEVK